VRTYLPLSSRYPYPMPSIPIRRHEVLRERLDLLVATFDISTLSPDPLELARRYDAPLDQELAGLLAAAFAYGRADVIVRNIGAMLARMGASPNAYLRDTFTRAEAARRFKGFTHRFHKAPELIALLERLARIIRTEGALGALFRDCYDGRDADIGPTLARFVGRIISAVPPASPAEQKSLEYLLTSPNGGSACKRMNLYLRWMIRRTSPDLGLWTFADPAKLVIPVDTHIHRIATFLGLNRRQTADWKAARAITDRLARFDAADPVRYDFALCRLGILDLCSRKKRKANCDVCLLRDACRFPALK
jgi:uncharacterized protein (TIGR02757 family)